MRLLWLLPLLLAGTSGFEITETSGDLMIIQGTSGLMFCRSDEPFEFCKWTNAEKELSCRTSSGEASSCGEDGHLTWEVDENTCGLRINSVSRLNDIGNYTCILSIFTDEGVFTDTAHVAVDVAVESLASFGGHFAASEDNSVMVDADQEVEVECSATGGYPTANVRAFFGPNKDEINDVADGGSDVELEFVEEELIASDEDETTSVSRKFTMVPSRDDCGKYVKCIAEQLDSNGNPIGDASTFDWRKIMVQFPPLPKDHEAIVISAPEDDNQTWTITLEFMANPMPSEDDQVMWHINPNGEDDQETIILKPGESNEDYSSPPLMASESGHGIEATLEFHQAFKPEMADWGYYLHVSTPKGEQKYEFTLELEEEPEVVDEVVEGEENDSIEGAPEAEKEEPVKGMGSGMIAVIIVLILGAIAAVVIIFFAKRNQKWCFKYNSVPTKPPTNPEDPHGHTTSDKPIIKNGSGEPDVKKSSQPDVNKEKQLKEGESHV